MKLQQPTFNPIEAQTASVIEQSRSPEPLEPPKATRGQRLADAMASKVGSWAFIGTQSVILAGWIGANSLPGVPHWDQSPFILLNLVFSFASAYTAPVVLMSQNRQSEEDRENASINHKVNLQTAQDIELLHQKIDQLQTRQLSDLMQIVQQQATHTANVAQAPSKTYFAAETDRDEQSRSLRDDGKPKTISVLLPQSIFNNLQSVTDVSSTSNLQTKHKFFPSVALELGKELMADESLHLEPTEQIVNDSAESC
jgi:uncharacterized membrane protein